MTKVKGFFPKQYSTFFLLLTFFFTSFDSCERVSRCRSCVQSPGGDILECGTSSNEYSRRLRSQYTKNLFVMKWNWAHTYHHRHQSSCCWSLNTDFWVKSDWPLVSLQKKHPFMLNWVQNWNYFHFLYKRIKSVFTPALFSQFKSNSGSFPPLVWLTCAGEPTPPNPLEEQALS